MWLSITSRSRCKTRDTAWGITFTFVICGLIYLIDFDVAKVKEHATFQA